MAIKSYRHIDAEDARAKVLENLDPKSIQGMRRHELVAYQSILGLGDKWGLLEAPEHWMPPGSLRSPSKRRCSLEALLPEGMTSDSPSAEAGWAALVRVCLLRLLVPVGRNRRAATVSTTMVFAVQLAKLGRTALTKQRSDDPEVIWGRLTDEDARAALTDRVWLLTVAYVMDDFVRAGYLSDSVQRPVRTSGYRRERNRKGDAAQGSDIFKNEPWQPLPDEFVAQCGWRALWLIIELGPTLLGAVEAAIAATDPKSRSDRYTLASQQFFEHRIRRKTISEWRWTTSEGQLIDEIPFRLILDERGSDIVGGTFSWPPRLFRQAFALLVLLQAAHSWIALLSAGPRSCELLSQLESCLVESPEGWRIEGRTYKLVFAEEGAVRHWPAPKTVVMAIKQQVRLARLLKRIGCPSDPSSMGDHLWVKFTRDVGRPLQLLGGGLNRLRTAFCLQHLLGSEHPSAHPHRFRKTLARLIALTLVNGRMVLMDVFGHDDPEMTVGYMTSDRRIYADVIKTVKELVVLIGIRAIDSADENGGRAAVRIRQAIADKATLVGKERLDPKDVEELAEQLTLEGRYWIYARPGVICTKPPGKSGPCNKKQGAPDPGNCRTSCDDRLELADHKAEVDEMLADIVDYLERARANEETMLIEHWRGQLMANLYRFQELYEKWRVHPLVASELLRQESAK